MAPTWNSLRARAWDDQVESRLQTDWAEMKTNIAWDDARPHVRHGWDSAGRTSNPQ